MKERPILFSGAMVRAILEGRKTQTRRLFMVPGCVKGTRYAITSPSEEILRFDDGSFHYLSTAALSGPYPCPYGQPGDRLWVRETWCSPEKWLVGYAADGQCGAWMGDGNGGQTFTPHGYILEAPGYRDSFKTPSHTWGIARYGARWRPSIHMPRWACRLVLEVTDVRVQRLQDITEHDATAEGFSPITRDCKRPKFMALWDSINAKRAPWSANPFVWAITFRRLA
ncbi:MAG: hypothetical protein JSS23_12460 [Proteobacteria bacterium]|nr:hypothetical protein [Pseudomonadota bacterium]